MLFLRKSLGGRRVIGGWGRGGSWVNLPRWRWKWDNGGCSNGGGGGGEGSLLCAQVQRHCIHSRHWQALPTDHASKTVTLLFLFPCESIFSLSYFITLLWSHFSLFCHQSILSFLQFCICISSSHMDMHFNVLCHLSWLKFICSYFPISLFCHTCIHFSLAPVGQSSYPLSSLSLARSRPSNRRKITA